MFGPLPAGEDISRCWVCGELVLLLDEAFYSALSKFLKYSYRIDRSLFARVKAEFPESSFPDKAERKDSTFPELEGVLAWVTKAWDKARKPRGKTREIPMHLFIASWIESLAAPHVVFEVTAEGSPTPRRIKPLMSFVDALDVLQGFYPPVGHTLSTSSGRKREFGGVDGDTLRQIHEEFNRIALEEFGVIPSLETREVQRILRWYRRWPDAKHRIQGNEVREK